VNLHELVSQLVIDTKGAAGALFSAPTYDSSLWAFLPELIICLTVLLLLAVRLPRAGRFIDTFWIALAGSAAALAFAAPWQHLGAVALTPEQAASPAAVTRMEIFTGMLVYDSFSVFVRSLLLAFAALFVIFTKLSGIPDKEDGPDIYSLVLGATLGMCLMATANHLLMVFMAVEMASVPSYVLAGIMKGRRQASEAALKYSVYGAGTAGVMLYGISLIGGLLNTAHLPTMAAVLAENYAHMSGGDKTVLALGALMVSVGLAFKLSAVPFHFWCPDVFEGATAEVNAFLSIASKAAALALLVRVAVGMSTIAPEGVQPGERTAMRSEGGGQKSVVGGRSENEALGTEYLVLSTQETMARSSVDSGNQLTPNSPLLPIRSFTAKLIAFFAIVTCTFGNLAAYGQNNLKRLLAYSTIAHAGYMMMPVAAAVAMAGIDNVGAQRAIGALAIYMVVYLFMNLAAFAVVAFLRNAMRSEELPDYAGLVRRAPLMVVCLAIACFSLIGMPPLSGFIGKFAIFASLVDGWQKVEGSGLGISGFYLLVLLLVGGINTAISLFYYLRVVKVMTIDDEPRDRLPFALSDVSVGGLYLGLITLPTALLIVSWDWLSGVSLAAARNLFS
jgi:NADH-quinone oxidoreductase subunit N